MWNNENKIEDKPNTFGDAGYRNRKDKAKPKTNDIKMIDSCFSLFTAKEKL